METESRPAWELDRDLCVAIRQLRRGPGRRVASSWRRGLRELLRSRGALAHLRAVLGAAFVWCCACCLTPRLLQRFAMRAQRRRKRVRMLASRSRWLRLRDGVALACQ